jgi:Tfp pilus assembly protein PilO
MNNFFSRLNSAERRFVVGVALLFFIVVNVVWIFPHFGDWSKTKARMEQARKKRTMFETEIAQKASVEKQVHELQSEGLDVPQEDQAFQLLSTINKQAAQSGVGFTGNSRQTATTNQFFLEQVHTINVQGGEKQLVDFLYSLGAGNSLIRVRDLSVVPDPPRQQLSARITLVASYQKKPQARSAAPARTTAPAPSAKPSVPAVQPPTAAVPAKNPSSIPAPAPAKQPATPKKK